MTGLNRELFAIKLYEMEQQYGKLLSRLRICGQADRDGLCNALRKAKEEYEETSLFLKRTAEGSRSPAVAGLAEVQWEYTRKAESLLKEQVERHFFTESCFPDQDKAEAASLYAEYALDFATLSMQYAMITALTAMDLQVCLDNTKEDVPHEKE